MPASWFSPARITVPLTIAAVAAAGFAVAPAAHAAVTPVTTRLVAGAATVTEATGVVWSSDAAFAAGGQVAAVRGRVQGTEQPKLFAAVRSGTVDYRIPVAGQSNVVTLGFVEPAGVAPGQRVFDVVAEGVMVAGGLDVAAAVGDLRAYRVTLAVRVTDGVLDLAFTSAAGAASVSNLKIVSSGAASPAPGKPVRAASVVSPETYGAKADGVTDDTAALQRAFDAAPTGQAVVLTAGRTYAHSGVLHLRKPWLRVTGAATLLATNEATSSVWIEADNVLVDGGLTIRTATTTRRWEAWEQMGVRIVGRTGVVLRSVTVDGSAAAGIYVGNGATKFVVDRVTVQNTRADGIHMTSGANHGLVLAPVVRNSGDDGVAVVSYQQDGVACHDITVVSPTVLGTTWGRGLSVVGGTRIKETDIDVRDTSAAAVYIAAEGNPWFTAAPQQVVVDGGTITGANTDTDVDHGAVLVLSGQTSVVPNAVTVQRLQITGTRASASRNLGVITYGGAPRTVLFQAISISGGPRSAYQGNTPTSSYRLVQVTKDGVPVPVGG